MVWIRTWVVLRAFSSVMLSVGWKIYQTIESSGACWQDEIMTLPLVPACSRASAQTLLPQLVHTQEGRNRACQEYLSIASVSTPVLISTRRSTFVTGDPAVIFSKNRGIANLPKAGVACKHSLRYVSGFDKIQRVQRHIPQSILQVLRRDAIWVVGWWPERDREVAERDVEEVLIACHLSRTRRTYP